jgi:hypothetical protein
MENKKHAKKIMGMVCETPFPAPSDIDLVEEYLNICFAEKNKRIKDLTETLSRLVFLHECEQEGLSSGQPTFKQWIEAVDKASEALSKANPDWNKATKLNNK